MLVFFDESHARSVGLNPGRLKVLFFTLLAAAASRRCRPSAPASSSPWW